MTAHITALVDGGGVGVDDERTALAAIDRRIENDQAILAAHHMHKDGVAWQSVLHHDGPVDLGATRGATWAVERHPIWDYERSWELGSETPGVKIISFVKRRPGLSTLEFAERYRGHGEVAKVHHGMWRYRQNIVTDVTATNGVVEDLNPPVDAVSELWFESIEAWADRLYVRDDSLDAVRADTKRFVDFRSTVTIATIERLLT